MSKPFNFYSGPAVLPDEVLEQAQEAILNFANTGLSILEISHRSKEFTAVVEECIALVKELMQLTDDHEVLFLQGGASLQFCMVPMNLLPQDETAAYFDTGQWAYYALTEASRFGNIHIAASSRQKNYNHIPRQYEVPANARYLHFTSNNTIYGTQFSNDYIHQLLDSSVPVVCDMSSDIFSRPLPFHRFGLIYASAQKNFGPAGVTLVVIHKNLAGSSGRSLPAMLDYRTHIQKRSMHNTPPCFALYVALLTLRWTKRLGLHQLAHTNLRKAQKLYNAIDNSAIFRGTVAREDRSCMNVCFTTGNSDLDEKFITFCQSHNIVGVKGYRTVGGMRASLYNAMPEAGVDALIAAMQEFEHRITTDRA
ncbi:MAG: 3-phosphoserine/phosphohydroxythreonine transaminase [Chitinophagales bacterium]|nr:3-phosphoserine/phosphohydroxythreonine transaminase [Chitinophagales bacterium]MDW8418694.1 3-phosphoserine/phosphohydroxythreonine transaminase [Chitinophagales bacterium]